MARRDRFIARLMSGNSDAGIDFDQLCGLLESLGFTKTIRGSHHIFDRPGIEQQINLQRDGRHAKRYQIRQVRGVLIKYGLVPDE